MIHPTAVVDPAARLGTDVTIGPYTVIEGPVEIGDGCRIGPHCHLLGRTRIGAGGQLHAGAVVGDLPQDKGFAGGESGVVIGDRCIIREYVTIHRGTAAGSDTVIGNGVMLMAFVHVAHNCELADDVVVANMSQLAGYVTMGERAFMSAGVGVHQFVRIGSLAMITGQARVSRDIPPYCLVDPDGLVRGPNVVGLRRAGMDAATRTAVKNALRTYFFSDLKPADAVARLATSECPAVAAFVAFVTTGKRSITAGYRGAEAEE